MNPHNLSEPDFLFLSRRRCGGALLAIFKSIHSLQFLSDWAVNWQDDTRHQSAQSLGVGSSDFPQGRCWSAPLEIFKPFHSLQYLSDWAETWYDNTRHQSAQSLGAGFLRCRTGAQNSEIFCGRHLYMFPSLAVAEIYLVDLKDERRSVRRCFLWNRRNLHWFSLLKLGKRSFTSD